MMLYYRSLYMSKSTELYRFLRCFQTNWSSGNYKKCAVWHFYPSFCRRVQLHTYYQVLISVLLKRICTTNTMIKSPYSKISCSPIHVQRLQEVGSGYSWWDYPLWVRDSFEQLSLLLFSILKLKDRGNVATSVAVVGSRPDCHQLAIKHVLDTLMNQLVGTTN